MSNTALITGASSGIGREFARYHASKGGDVILTARREAALNELKEELEAKYSVRVDVIALDLGAEGGADALYDRVKDLGVQVDVLINNAGFGGHGAFLDRELSADLAMIDLNIKSLVTLSHRFGRDMMARGGGKMLQVSSTASYMPGPLQATYFATKAFVSSFSQAINREMQDKGVTSTALEPGAVRTEFFEAADLEGTNLGAGRSASPEDVAQIGYDAMMAGKLQVINDGQLNFMLKRVLPFLPRKMRLNMVYNMQVKNG